MSEQLHDGPKVIGDGVIGPLLCHSSGNVVVSFREYDNVDFAACQALQLRVIVFDGPKRVPTICKARDLELYKSRKERGEE